MSSAKKSFMIADILEPRGHTPTPRPLSPPPAGLSSSVYLDRGNEAHTRGVLRAPRAFTRSDMCMEWPLYWWPSNGPFHPLYGPTRASVADNLTIGQDITPYDLSNNKSFTSYNNSLNNILTSNNNSMINYSASNNNSTNHTFLTNTNNTSTDFAHSLTNSRFSHPHNFMNSNNVNITSSSSEGHGLTSYNNSLISNYLTKRSLDVQGVGYLDSNKFTTAGAGLGGGGGGGGRFPLVASRALERRFLQRRHATRDERRLIARALALTERQVKTWFQNRRAKWRRSGR